jgi:hypothetical protein
METIVADLCEMCRPAVNSAVYNQDFIRNLCILLLPLAVLFIVGLLIHFAGSTMKFHKEEGIQ